MRGPRKGGTRLIDKANRGTDVKQAGQEGFGEHSCLHRNTGPVRVISGFSGQTSNLDTNMKKMQVLFKTLKLVGVITLLVLAASGSFSRAAVLITFDDLGLPPLGDVTTQYAAKGVVFKGITDAGAEVNLEVADSSIFPDNNPPSPPYSLSNFYNHDSGQRAQTMRILFSSPASGISFMYNGAGFLGSSTLFKVYSSAGVLLNSFQVASAIDSGFHPVSVPDANVGYLDIVNPQPGWGHYIDNLQFGGAPCGTFITFDDVGLPPLGDLTTQYAAKGVVFSGFTDAGAEVSLEVADSSIFPDNQPPTPPYSLSNFYNHDSGERARIMRILFSTPASGISFMYNGAGSLGSSTSFKVYSPAGVLLNSFQVASAVDSEFHAVTVADAGVGYVDIVNPQPGWGHYIDNLQFGCTPTPCGTMITFDDLGLPPLGDLTTEYAAKGVVFSGLTDAGQAVNLEVADSSIFPDNNPPSLPYSLSNFYNHDPSERAQIMSIVFSAPASNITFMYNGAGSLGASTVFKVYSSAGVLLNNFHVASAIDSAFHSVIVPDDNVGHVDIVSPQSGWGHYIDNLQFGCTNGPTLITIKPAVALCWPSVPNAVYQVQWASQMEPAFWFNLGSPVTGDGGIMAVYDIVAAAKRFYRLAPAPAPFVAGLRKAQPLASPSTGNDTNGTKPLGASPMSKLDPERNTNPAVDPQSSAQPAQVLPGLLKAGSSKNTNTGASSAPSPKAAPDHLPSSAARPGIPTNSAR